MQKNRRTEIYIRPSSGTEAQASGPGAAPIQAPDGLPADVQAPAPVTPRADK